MAGPVCLTSMPFSGVVFLLVFPMVFFKLHGISRSIKKYHAFFLAAAQELINLKQGKHMFSFNFIAKTRLRASTILANFFQTYNNNITWTSYA